MKRTHLAAVAAVVLLAGACSDPEPTAVPRTGPPTATTAPVQPWPTGHGRFEDVRLQLQSDPTVVRQMLLAPEATGTFGCGMHVLGWDPAGKRLYVWLSCQDYRTGVDAEARSGSSMPAVVDLGREHGWLVMGVQFPRQWALQEDYRTMFPPAVRRRALRSNIPVTPTQAEFLEAARATVVE